MKKFAAFLMVALLLCSFAACAGKTQPPAQTTPPATEVTQQPTAVPIDYTVFKGNYSDTKTIEGPCYTVSIINVDNTTKAIELTISYVGINSSPLYTTDTIYATIVSDHTVQFDWTDSWENQGNGTLVLDPADASTVQLEMTVTQEAEINRATLSTHGQYKTLTRQ